MKEQIEFEIRDASLFDIPSLVDIHSKSLSQDVFVKLGKRFLVNFYLSIFKRNDLKIYVAEHKNKVLGFLTFSLGDYSIISHMNSLMYLDILMGCIRDLRLFFRIFKQMIYLKTIRMPEIVFFAVTPEFQNMGIGRKLLSRVFNFLKNKNLNEIMTKTSNKKLGEFYTNCYDAKEIYHFKVFDQCYKIFCWEI